MTIKLKTERFKATEDMPPYSRYSIVTPRFLPGLLAHAFDEYGESLAANIRLNEAAFKSYDEYVDLSELASLTQIGGFVNGFIKGKVDSYRLHGSTINEININNNNVEDNSHCDIAMDITQEINNSEHFFVLKYYGVRSLSVSTFNSFMSINAHEVFINNDLFQHNIYLFGGDAIRIIFSSMRVDQKTYK